MFRVSLFFICIIARKRTRTREISFLLLSSSLFFSLLLLLLLLVVVVVVGGGGGGGVSFVVLRKELEKV